MVGGGEKSRAGRSDDGRAKCLRRACRCADVSGREICLGSDNWLDPTTEETTTLARVVGGERWEDGGEETWGRRVEGLRSGQVGVVVHKRSGAVRAGR